MHKKFTLLILVFLFTNTTYGQTSISKSALAQDLDVLKLNLETYHTGLYTYTSKKEFDRWFEKAKENLNDATAYQFFRKINELNSIIRNGHTYFIINPNERELNLKMPPFSIYKFKNSFYVKSVTTTENQAIIGKEIVSLNGVNISEVFHRLLNYKKRDGNNSTQPKEELLDSFSITYAIHYGTKEKTSVEILNNSIVKTIELVNVPFNKTESETEKRYDNGKLKFTIDDSIAILTIPTFYQKALKKDKYKKKLKKIFSTIRMKNVKHLIIDVRNNGGGNTPMVEELISYINPKPSIFYKDVYQLHKKWDKSIIPSISEYPKDISQIALRKGNDNFYRNKGSDGTKINKPKKNVYPHELFILTNGNTLSAAAEFTSFIKQHRKATFIGEESGGNKVQNTSGDWLKFLLPNSKLAILIPYVVWEMNVDFDNDGYGIQPDHWIRNTIEDELNNTDRALNFTKTLIKKKY